MDPERPAPLPHSWAFPLLTLLLLPLGCGGSESPTESSPPDEPDPAPSVSTIDVVPDSAVLDSVGAVEDFDATALDSEGGPIAEIDFAWISSDTAVAEVDEQGTATARAPGEATVTARARGTEGHASLRVTEPSGPDGPVYLRRSFRAFEGVHHPPDHDIAAGPTRLIAVSNESTVLLSKEGSTLDEADGHEMFALLRREGEGTFDPRVAYDPDTGRFFLLYTAVDRSTLPCDPGECVNHVYLAVSRSSWPASLPPDGWHLYGLDATIDGDSATSNTADFPRLGIGERAVYLVMIMVPSDPGQREGGVYTKIRILDKQKLVDGDSVGWTDFVRMADPVTGEVGQLEMQPVVRQPGGGMFFVNLARSSSCDYGVWQVRSPLADPTLQSTVAVAGEPFGPDVICRHPTDAEQPGDTPRLSTLRPVAIPAEAVYRNGSLWVARHVRIRDEDGDRGAIRWSELSVADGPSASILQDGILRTAGAWTFYPAVMADADGRMGMVFGRSSASEHASLYFTHRRGGDPPNELREPILLREGEASLTTGEENFIPGDAIRYADFFGMSRDPSDGSWWMLGEYVVGPDRWGGWVANVRF